MTGITEDVLGALLKSVRGSFEPDAYRDHLRAEAMRFVPPDYYNSGGNPTIEPTIEMLPHSELKRAKALLEKHGYTVVPTDRLVSVPATHTFGWREVASFKDQFDHIADSVLGSLSAQLGIKIVEQGGAVKHLIQGPLGVLIGHSAVVLVPEKK